MLLGALDASFLGNLLTNKGTIWTSEDTMRAGDGTFRAGHDF